MTLNLVPSDFVPPTLIKDDYLARKLTAKDVYLDFIAVKSSEDIIKQTRGGSWPDSTLTFEDDLIDLAWHQREFENLSSFAYTIMSKDQTKCLGCIYIYPMGFRSQVEGDYDADVSWWITEEMYKSGRYTEVSNDIKQWIEKFWPFKKVFYSNKVLPQDFIH